MTHTKRILVSALALMFTSSVFAASGATVPAAAKVTLAAPTNLKMVLKSDTTVSLEWDKVVGATSYTVKYGKQSVATSKDPLAQYEDETDPVTSTGKIVEKLTPNTEYFFSVVSLDDKMNESDLFSNELTVKTDMTGAVSASGAAVVATGSGAPVPTLTAAPATPALAIDKLLTKAVDNKTINLFFNNELSADPVTVKITKTNDNSDIGVATVTPDAVNKKEVVVKLMGILEPNSAYSFVVLAAKDTAGVNIQNGTDGMTDLTTDANLAVSTDMLSASGATASGATAATELPKTGPEQNLIVIAALLIAGALVYGYRARKA